MPQVDIAAETQALPLGYYLSAPLTAAIEAQALSAHSTVEFVDILGTDEFGALRTMEFKYLKGITDPSDGSLTQEEVTLTVPTLAMVEAPHMSIENLSVDFEFKIKDVITKSNQLKLSSSASTEFQHSTQVKAQTSGLAAFLFGKANVTSSTSFKANMNVSAAYQRNAAQNTERQATLKMSMTAKQRVPEGFKRVLDIFADAISSQADTDDGGNS
ncbi:DUF2589 domain-containing protein [Aliishimia ponticola]|nr:DUF2589 domain-containing protein [Aliishimia ponticola]